MSKKKYTCHNRLSSTALLHVSAEKHLRLSRRGNSDSRIIKEVANSQMVKMNYSSLIESNENALIAEVNSPL